MSQLVRYEVRDRVAVVAIDNPPVNALSAGVPEGISEVHGFGFPRHRGGVAIEGRGFHGDTA